MPGISAIVPTFNRSAYLQQALDALLGQTREVEQIIVWDDGSTDGTSETMSRLNDPRIEYRRAGNAGKAAALNQAMQLARGDYIWICDDDDIALPDAAEKMAAVLEREPETGIAGGTYKRFRDTGAGGRKYFDAGYWPDLNQGTPLRHLLEDIFLFQNATLVRRRCYDRVGPFREDLPRSIDYDMIVRLATRYPVRMLSDTLFLQRKHDGDRGPLGHRHSAEDSETVWATHDQIVFERLHRHLPLSLMQAMFEGDRLGICRAALLQRGGVFARHHLWDRALDDFELAARISPERALGPCSANICRRAVSGKHGVRLTEAQIARLVRLRRISPAGRDIAASLGRGLIWSLRRALQTGNRRKTLQMAHLVSKTRLRMRPRHATDRVQERQEIRLDAYDW
ncbi:glycosyltransferase family 2 protein [Marivita sp. GX14005]|uniref:glycosyltransferase family 2 protein n=1 Tax=Marivita sp. GX14005 TaxID=2942276 RepID=UPI002019D9B1|nr:glycosyltransferase [Marivita sp. GX14005]